jgi:hypothetical protein
MARCRRLIGVAPGTYPKQRKASELLPTPPCHVSACPDRSTRRHTAKPAFPLTVSAVRLHEVATSSPDPASAARGSLLASIEGLSRPSWQHRSTVHARDRSRQFPLGHLVRSCCARQAVRRIPLSSTGLRSPLRSLVRRPCGLLRNLSCPYRSPRKPYRPERPACGIREYR